MKKRLLSGAIIVCVLICLMLCSCDHGKKDTYSDTLTFSDFNDLYIDMTAENITMHVVTDGENHVDYSVTKSGLVFGSPCLDVTEKNKTVKINSSYGFLVLGEVDIQADIYIKKESISKLDIEMTSGSFTLCDNLTVSELVTDLTSGCVDIQNVVVADCDVDLTSGEACISGEISKCDVDLTSGIADITSTVMPDKVSGDITSGNIRLFIPDSKEGFKMNYDIISGDINCDFPLTGFNANKGTAICYQGKSEFDFDMTSGTVDIKKIS